VRDLQGRRVLVVGLGRSGLAVARFLARRGARVTVTDQRHPNALAAEARELMAQKVGLELGCHREQTFIAQDLIVVSPGVPADLPPLELARREGIQVVPEIELASWFLKSPIVGITGTNGKTTTTALTGAILEASGFSTFVGGNIGVPLIQAAEQSPAPSVVVAEVSSFQLETIESFRPRVAVLLNLTPNHLDRHPTFEAYARAKKRLFENQTPEDHAILNADDANVAPLADSIQSQKTFFSLQRELASGVFVAEGKIWYRVRHLERALMETQDVRLRGSFNLENVLAAAAAACVAGADFGAMRRAVREFPGVEHRLEFVREIAGVGFYNDSKATSVDAAAKALSTFERGVHLILGGKDKGAPYAPLRQLLKDRVREVLLIGAAAEKIGRELSGAVELVQAGTIEAAGRRAFEQARPGDTVLLSPACSSFDQFQDFEQRGRIFKQLVSALAREYNEGKIRPFEVGKPDFVLSSGRSEEAAPKVALAAKEKTGGSEGRTSPQSVPAAPTRVVLPETGEKAAASVAAGPPGSAPAASEPETHPSLRTSQPRELVYVYEVSAEEIGGAGETEAGQERFPAEVAEAGGAGPAPEPPNDPAMAYEVRAADSRSHSRPVGTAELRTVSRRKR
jgi:UDP-N-acetylmuramoylalanine--D-glutamate ligase